MTHLKKVSKILKDRKITIRIDADIAEILDRQRAAAIARGEEVTIAAMIRNAIRKCLSNTAGGKKEENK